MKKFLPLLIFPASMALGASKDCAPSQPASCNTDACAPCYCLGPTDPIANAPVRPFTCDGDVEVSASLLYWRANMDGLIYGYYTNSIADFYIVSDVPIDTDYVSPAFKYNFGFQVGLAYNSSCDGWDLGLKYTNFRGRGFSHNTSNIENNPFNNDPNTFFPNPTDSQVLAQLWTAFEGSLEGRPNFVAEITTEWSAPIQYLDLELGREAWVSRRLSLRPYIGARFLKLEQHFSITGSGGLFGEITGFYYFQQPAYYDETKIKNAYSGIGPSLGMDLVWNFGCGWSVDSRLGSSILYGRFTIEHNETLREAESPFSATIILATEERLKASRATADLSLGIEWFGLVCDCKYGVRARLNWESHLFFHQNQMWVVARKAAPFNAMPPFPKNNGQNYLVQNRGTLSTHGLTFSVGVDY